MKSKKVAIFLALAAISIVTLFVISLIDGEALGAEPSIDSEPGKNKVVENQDVLTKAGPRDFLPVFVFQGAPDFKVLPGPAFLELSRCARNDRKAE